MKHSTAHYYHRTFRARLLPAFGSYPLVSITADRIQTFVAEMSREGLSPASIRNYAAPLGRCLKHAVQWGYLRNNPVPSVEMPKLKREEKRFLSPTQVGQLLQNVPDQWKPMFTTAALTGMRLGERLAMPRENLDWDEAQYHVKERLFLGRFDTPKSIESPRPIDLSPAVLTALRTHRSAQNLLKLSTGLYTDLDPVFAHENGKPTKEANAPRKVLRESNAAAEVPSITFHGLRHSYASLLIDEGSTSN